MMVQKKLLLKNPAPKKVESEDVLTTVQEVAVYLHRFHNLDLFHQGYANYIFSIIVVIFSFLFIFLNL